MGITKVMKPIESTIISQLIMNLWINISLYVLVVERLCGHLHVAPVQYL